VVQILLSSLAADLIPMSFRVSDVEVDVVGVEELWPAACFEHGSS
jgi:hypothetical protein